MSLEWNVVSVRKDFNGIKCTVTSFVMLISSTRRQLEAQRVIFQHAMILILSKNKGVSSNYVFYLSYNLVFCLMSTKLRLVH